MKSSLFCQLCAAGLSVAALSASEHQPIGEQLKTLPYRIAYESYVDNNWEIFTMNPDGSNEVDLTKTPGEHEHYPQVSPDGTKICYTVDSGEGRETIRSLWIMNPDGTKRKKLVDQ